MVCHPYPQGNPRGLQTRSILTDPKARIPTREPVDKACDGWASPPPILALQAICRRAAAAGWRPADYLEVARWCHRYRPEATGLWLRLALGVAL